MHTTAASPRPHQRQRTGSMATTPPATAYDPEGIDISEGATRVLSVEATALSHVTRLYSTDPVARDGSLRAVKCVSSSQAAGGKVVVCGVGKSGLVGAKTVATLKSLGIGASFMHASEAAHGDSGDIRTNDVSLFISYSGRTPELLNILPHLPSSLPIVAMTSHLKASECPLLESCDDGISLPAPIHEKEDVSFGVCAPTTSTTVAIAIGDMLALTVAERMHCGNTGQVFKKNHPGGAIGQVTRAEKLAETPEAVTPLELPSPSISAKSEEG